MPIRPENRKRYPRNWRAIRAAVLERAGGRCEGSPEYPDCRAANGAPHPVTGSRVVLTIAHLDHIPENCDGMQDEAAPTARPREQSNLRAWCQRCHNHYDKLSRHERRQARRLAEADDENAFNERFNGIDSKVRDIMREHIGCDRCRERNDMEGAYHTCGATRAFSQIRRLLGRVRDDIRTMLP